MTEYTSLRVVLIGFIVLLLMLITISGIVVWIAESDTWYRLSKWWKARNKRLADYTCNSAAMIDGVMSFKEYAKLEHRIWDIEDFSEELTIVRLRTDMDDYLKRRFHLADKVLHRIQNLPGGEDLDVEKLSYKYLGG